LHVIEGESENSAFHLTFLNAILSAPQLINLSRYLVISTSWQHEGA
jgi:hypothetical protein